MARRRGSRISGPGGTERGFDARRARGGEWFRDGGMDSAEYGVPVIMSVDIRPRRDYFAGVTDGSSPAGACYEL